MSSSSSVKNKFFTREFVLAPKYRRLSKNGGLRYEKLYAGFKFD